MDIATMHIAVKQELDKTSALELPAFEPEEIDFWLNNAIRKFVKTRYSGVNIKGQSFEQTQKRTDDLRTLVKFAYITSMAGGSYPNSSAFTLPSSTGYEYWFALNEEVTIRTANGDKRVGVTEITQDEYTRKLEDPFSEHLLHYDTAKPLRLFMGTTGVTLIPATGYSIVGYHLTYLKKPATVQVTATAVDCDLPEHTHDEIVKMAANMMLENIEQPRYNTHMSEVVTME
jgi:hypothetical protein